MAQYYKFNVKVFEYVKDMEKSCVLMFIIQMAQGNKEVLLQKTWISKKLFCSRTKTERLIKGLREAGLIETETTYIVINGVTKTTTRFMFTAKLLELLGEEKQTTKQPSKPSIKSKEDKESNQSQQIDYSKIYEYYANKMLNDLDNENTKQ